MREVARPGRPLIDLVDRRRQRHHSPAQQLLAGGLRRNGSRAASPAAQRPAQLDLEAQCRQPPGGPSQLVAACWWQSSWDLLTLMSTPISKLMLLNLHEKTMYKSNIER